MKGQPRPSLIVLDNFHPRPEEQRAKALRAEFVRHGNDGPRGYRYRTAKPDPIETLRLVDRILPFIGEHYRSRFGQSLFVLETEEDQEVTRRSTWVHFDPWRWVGVLYLNTPDQCRGGTSFFRHRRTGIKRWESVLEDKAQGGALDKEFHADSPDLSKWETIDTVSMQFNRLVLFDPYAFHQATCYFGHTIEDGRLFQQFTFDRHPLDSDGKELSWQKR